MKLRYLFLLIPLSIGFKHSFAQTTNKEISGHWEGAITRMGSIQMLSFDFEQQMDTITGSYNDPAIARFEVPLFKLKLDKDTLEINFGYGPFKCFYHHDLQEITGISIDWDPQVYFHIKKTGSKIKRLFASEEVQYKSGDIKIAGSIYKPFNKKEYPLVILIHAFGKGTRDMSYYHSLAFNLAQNGIGVLVYDKRGYGQSEGEPEKANFYELANDVLAGVNYLKSRKDLPINKLGILGESQGGWVAPIAAKKSKEVSFVILNVGPAVSLFQQDIDRIQYSMKTDGFKQASIDSATTYASLYFDYVHTSNNWETLEQNAQLAKTSGWHDYVFIPEVKEDENIAWWKRFEFDPAPFLTSLQCPVLSLMGERDVLVSPKSNEQLMQNYLIKAGVKYDIKIFPNCGHSMQSSDFLKGDSWHFPQKYWVWRRKAPGYYEAIIKWVNEA